jgi:uncharacterized protein YjaG (DUF416 family)
MESAFDSNVLEQKLSSLDRLRQLAFGVSCCERLVPNYLAFQIDAGWGDIKPIREALDLVWSSLEGQLYQTENVRQLINHCESVAPNSGDFTSLYVTAAQDACFSVCGLLDFLLDGDVEKVVLAARYATDSVDLFVQEIENMSPSDRALEQKILSHPLMQRELENQKADLAKVAQAPIIDAKLLVQLRSSSSNNGKSNLNLP